MYIESRQLIQIHASALRQNSFLSPSSLSLAQKDNKQPQHKDLEKLPTNLHYFNVDYQTIETFRGDFRAFCRKFLGKLRIKTQKCIHLCVNAKADVYRIYKCYVLLVTTGDHAQKCIGGFSKAEWQRNFPEKSYSHKKWEKTSLGSSRGLFQVAKSCSL
jgi:hypothetical protein